MAALASATAGILSALLLTFPHAALAWDWQNLPSGYGMSNYTTICHIATDPCVNGEGSTCNHVTITAPGTGFPSKSETDCVNPDFQAHIDSYVNATICVVNPAAGQSQGMCLSPTTTLAPSAPTATATTAATTSSPAVATATPTAATPPSTTAATVTPTATITVATTDPTVEARLVELERKYGELLRRVDAIATANTASWDAYIAAIRTGATAEDAAIAARSAGLNAIYLL